MSQQQPQGKWQNFRKPLKAQGGVPAYFCGSQKKLGPLLLDGREVARPRSEIGPNKNLVAREPTRCYPAAKEL
ncbi:MAG: hypothetical protein WCF59_15205 [Desulfobaccales bacterium]